MLDIISKTTLIVFIFTSMFAIGLQIRKSEMLYIFREKKLLIKSLISNFVMIPLIGIFFVKTFQMQPEIEMAFLLLACSPGGISALQFTSKTKSELAYSGEITFLLSILAVFISPLMISFSVPKEIILTIPYLRIFSFLLFFLLAPMIIGVIIHSKYKSLSNMFSKPSAIIGTLSFVLFIVFTLEIRKQAMDTLSVGAIGWMLLFIVLTMIIGWVMGGPSKGTRQVLATASSMRNAALCLVIGANTFNCELQIVALSALMIPLNLIFTAVVIFWNRKIASK